jgi:type 2 lantibiotic biosynthesis protein LanM
MATANAAAKDPQFWQAPEWYRALSLTERIGPRDTGTRGLPSTASADADKALRRLQEWKSQSPFQQEDLFEKRLALDSISEQDFLSLLAEHAESLRDRISAVPDWLAGLGHGFTHRRAFETILPLLEDARTNHPLDGCLPALSPLLQRGLSYLEDAVHALRQKYAVLPLDTGVLPKAFLANILSDLLFQISKPMIMEMHIARLLRRLQGETPEDRFHDFMRQLSQEGLILPLLAKYPVLARQLVITIDNWSNYLCDFLAHLCADWEAIRATFTPDSDPGPLMEVQAGKGDRHRKGRSVLLLRFGSGMQLLYKPKPLAADAHFQELLTWLNERGAEPRLRTLKLIDRGDYGWSEFVLSSPCTGRDEVQRFYERQGAYLALLYALDATDFYNENLIASGEHPMFVDLEALFHPHVHDKDPAFASNLAAKAMDQSVWQVGILPRWIPLDKDSPGVDMSGLGGQPGQMMPYPLVRWKEAGSDQMRLARERVEMPVSQNRPRLGDQEVDILDYRDAIIAGFTKMYRLLCQQRKALLTEQLPRFAHDEIRVIIRSTRIYGTLLYESFHPDLLRDALDRDRFFDRLWDEVAHRPYLTRFISAERKDLLQGDIPLFSTFPESRTIFSSDGEPLVDFLDTPSLDLVRQRVEKLGEEDLAKQLWIIEASLATLLVGREYGVERRLQISPIRRPVKKERLLGLADAIGRRLQELALQNDDGAYWLGMGLIDEYSLGLFPTGIDLYDGTSGIALFLAYLGAVTGKTSYTCLAKRALASVRRQLEEQEKYSSNPSDGTVDGLGSVIYLLAHLGTVWRDPALLREAEKLVERLPPLIAKDDRLDVIYGSAGCSLSALSLHAVHPCPRTLEVAIQCGDRLLAAAQPMPQGTAWKTLSGQPPLGGFSHGTAGIAFSLLKLLASSRQERFRQTALAALAFERSLFVPELNNWADLRVFPARKGDSSQANESPAEAKPSTMVAWCHGAAGIGLGRLGALEQLGDAKIREEIDVALKATIQYGFGGNHSLCHGALGNVELLLTAARLLNRAEDYEALERATAVIVGSVEANGWICGVPLGVETPGLMTGLAGIGYELLRLAEPEMVPPVLLLAPPCPHPRG